MRGTARDLVSIYICRIDVSGTPRQHGSVFTGCVYYTGKYIINGSFLISCGVFLFLFDGYFDIDATSEWTHIVMNYIGPDNGQGIEVYVDGILAEVDEDKLDYTSPEGNPAIQIGWIKAGGIYNYANINVDEFSSMNV